MVTDWKSTCSQLQFLPSILEERINACADNGGITLSKANYKQFEYNFIKRGGSIQLWKVIDKADAKKTKQSKTFINFFLVVFGDSVRVNYQVEEEGKTFTFNKTLMSGEVLAIDSRLKGFAYGVSEVIERPQDSGIVMRDGSLVIIARRLD